MHGPGHFSDVVTQSCGKGKFNPQTSKINFTVPSLRVLKNVQTAYPKAIRPGLIDYTLDCAAKDASKGKQFVLSFDRKKIVQGVTSADKGDMNLWGNENPPLATEKRNLQKALTCCALLNNTVKELPQNSQQSTKDRHVENIQKMSKLTSLRLKKLHKRQFGQHVLEQKLMCLKENNHDKKNNYEYALSFIVANTYKLQSCTRHALQYNLHLCQLLANLNDVPHWVSEMQHVFLHKQPNYFSLLPPQHLSHFLNLDDRTHFPLIKQRTPEWHNLCKKESTNR